MFIIFFKFIILLCGTDNIPRSIPGYSHIEFEEHLGILHGILSIPHGYENVMLFDSNYTWFDAHNISKQCVSVHMGIDNLSMRCPHLVEVDSHSDSHSKYECESTCTRLGHPMLKFSRPTWTNATLLDNVTLDKL